MKMVRFRSILDKFQTGRDELDGLETSSVFYTRSSSIISEDQNRSRWEKLESYIQRGKLEEVVAWRQEWEREGLEEQGEAGKEGEDGEDGEDGVDGEETRGPSLEEIAAVKRRREQEWLTPRYLRRSVEIGGQLVLTPVQLAVIEQKRDVLAALITGLTGEELVNTVVARVAIVGKEEYTNGAERQNGTQTRKLFLISSLSGSSVVEPNAINWDSTYEWNLLHVAVKYSVDCLKLLLCTLETKLDAARLEEILSLRDSSGRDVLHLAARNQYSSTPVKLLLDSGSRVNSQDNSLVTPLHLAVRFGVVDTLQELYEHGADEDRCSVDVTGRSLLHYAHSPQIIRFLLSRGYKPDLDTLKYQTDESGAENVEALLEDSVWIDRDLLLVLDFSLAMEQDKDGNLKVDGESVFLKNFATQRNLLHVPLVEALLQMKWFACRRVILMDLLMYMFFIFCLTGVICLSTTPLKGKGVSLSRTELELVDLVLKNYREEVEKRGWRFIPRSTSQLDKYVYHIDLPSNISRPQVSTAFGLDEDSTEYDQFYSLYYFTVFLSTIFVMRELLELVSDGPRQYLSSVENIFEIFIIFLTVLCQIFLRYYSENVYFYEILQVVTVFFGWLGLTFHMGKLPAIGIYIFLAIKVLRELVLSLLVFTTILLAFAFSFHLAMRKHHVFDNPFTSFLKMINMMAGEYNFDYNFTFNSVRGVGGSNGLVQILLVCFILLVSITIANLIVALVISNINKLMVEADAYQLSKTVDLLFRVHNVKQTLIRGFPCLKNIFAPTLHDYIGKRQTVCVRITEKNPRLSFLTRLQNSFRATDTFYPVYTYDPAYRREVELTDLALSGKIVQTACNTYRERQKDSESVRLEGDTGDYTNDWRVGIKETEHF